MKTECPHCHAVFRVSEQTLQHSAGQVRCGHCLAIFTAEIPRQLSFDDLLDMQESVAPDVAPEMIAAKSATPSSTPKPRSISRKLEAALRRNVPPPEEKNTSGNADHADVVDSAEIQTDVGENTNVEIPPADIEADTVENGVEEKSVHVLPDVIPPALRAETRVGKKRFGFISGLLWSLAIWLLIIAGVAQYAWYDRLHLLQYPQARPWFELACNYLNCRLPEPRDVSLIELSRKNIYTHPNNKRGLMVSGTMENQAEFAQAFPVLELRFANIRGETIAARRFKPGEYLDLPENEISKMQPGEPVAFTLEIVDPGQDVVSYEFTFL